MGDGQTEPQPTIACVVAPALERREHFLLLVGG